MAKNGRRTSAGTPDYFLLAALCILLVFGLAMLSSASSDLGKQLFNNSYYYLEHQLEFRVDDRARRIFGRLLCAVL